MATPEAIVSFLYKAADARNDAATYGLGGGVGGAALGTLLGGQNSETPGRDAILGALAGTSLGVGYGLNKDRIDGTAAHVFTDTHESNPFTTALGIGALSAGSAAGHDWLTNKNTAPETLKEHASGGPLNDPATFGALGDAPLDEKQTLMKTLAGREDSLTNAAKTTGAAPRDSMGSRIRANLSKLLNDLGGTPVVGGLASRASDAIARPDAARTILDDPAGFETAKNEASTARTNKLQKVEGDIASLKNSGQPAKEISDALKALVEQRGKLKTTGPMDTNKFREHMRTGAKAHDAGRFKRLGAIGLGAGALGTIAASLENKLYN